MRGTRTLAAFLGGLTLLAPLALFATAEDSQPERPAPDATVARERPGLVEFTGHSALHVAGACLDAALPCAGEKWTEDGSFFLPSPAMDGRLVVSWNPVNDSLRALRVHIGGLARDGQSPIVIDYIGLAAGTYTVRVEPIGRVVGVHDQPVDWAATFLLAASPTLVERHGRSTYSAGACLPEACALEPALDSDTIVVPWEAAGEIVATWEGSSTRRLEVRGTAFAAEGVSPLALHVDGLPAGEHLVDLRPVDPVLPFASGDATWVARLVAR